jgi:chromosome segregation ATPase
MNISGQAFDVLGSLLNLLADPKAYEEQLTTLRKAIAENKKYVELIAPAGEIDNMLEKQRANKAKTEEVLLAAKTKAQEVTDNAMKRYSETIKEAERAAAEIFESANALKAKAQAEMDEAKRMQSAITDAEKAAKAHTAETTRLATQHKQLETKLAAVEKEQKEVERLRLELSSKLDKLRDL